MRVPSLAALAAPAALGVLFSLPLPAAAQPAAPAAAMQPAQPTQPGRLVLPDFSGLAQKASEAVNISLDPSMLGIANAFLSADPRSSDNDVKSLVNGIQGIYVRSYSFNRAGAYSKADIDSVRAQLTNPAWVALVSTHDSAQNADIYIRRRGDRTEGMAIITTEPRQFTIVNIVGNIDLAKLASLQGKFGIPSVSSLGQSSADR
ncbi:MAG TPA: DUF4252 domain-containing protein [Steroidobacteraceae bacterium]|nr:DUF4252 domain-containing protein [Steroidobacteraceae bacterium]